MELRSRLGSVERDKLDYHFESLSSLESRLSWEAASCGSQEPELGAITDGNLYESSSFPHVLDAQFDIAVLAMECGLSRVSVIQSSCHSSQLVMSEFEGEEFYDPNDSVSSHDASHYGEAHDWDNPTFVTFVQQRAWFARKFAELLERLESRPEGDGTMLDHSIVVLMSEVSDGATHSHSNMPFIVAGGAGGAWSTGRLMDAEGYTNGNLWISIAQAMGANLSTFGDFAEGGIPGL